MNANVDAAIRSKHSNDLIVSECKDGPTQGASHRRLDYWVLRRSWSRPAMIGYECKSGRADFLSDKKWHEYLPLCNELWFIVHDKKSIQPEELPESVGLLRCAGRRLITVRRAVWRDIPIPEGLVTYVLMCRTAVKCDWQDRPDDDRAARAERWRDLLADKDECKIIGRAASRAIRERYEQSVERVARENTQLREDISRMESLKAALANKGIEWSRWLTADSVESEIKAKPWSVSQVKAARDVLDGLLKGVGE